MENATKALLIAAAVLIAIVLIAFGVKVLGSAGDASSQAGEVSKKINSAATNAVTDVDTALNTLQRGE